MIFPNFPIIDDDGGTEASSRVDASAGDGNRSEVNHEDSEANGEWCQDGNMGVSGITFRISGGEDGVEKNKGAHNLDGKAGASAVTIDKLVRATAVVVVAIPLECLDQGAPAQRPQALSYDVEQGADQRYLSCHKHSECHCWIYVSSRDTGGAVNEDEDHSAEDPRDSDRANSAADIPAVQRVHLAFISDHRQNGDV